MKKILIFTLIIVVAFLLTGCKAKDVSTEKMTVPPTTDDSASEKPPITDDTAPALSDASSLTSAIDVTSIDTVFNQNFTLAQEDAKKILGDGAKFCFAKVNFLGGVILTKGEMNYFFVNDAKIADYYWLVSFDSTQDNQKKRYLAAKRDWGNPVCTSLTAPSSFASAYKVFIENGTIDASSVLASAKVNMTLVKDAWKIELFNTEGSLILSETSTAAPVSTASPTS